MSPPVFIYSEPVYFSTSLWHSVRRRPEKSALKFPRYFPALSRFAGWGQAVTFEGLAHHWPCCCRFLLSGLFSSSKTVYFNSDKTSVPLKYKCSNNSGHAVNKCEIFVQQIAQLSTNKSANITFVFIFRSPWAALLSPPHVVTGKFKFPNWKKRKGDSCRCTSN